MFPKEFKELFWAEYQDGAISFTLLMNETSCVFEVIGETIKDSDKRFPSTSYANLLSSYAEVIMSVPQQHWYGKLLRYRTAVTSGLSLKPTRYADTGKAHWASTEPAPCGLPRDHKLYALSSKHCLPAHGKGAEDKLCR